LARDPKLALRVTGLETSPVCHPERELWIWLADGEIDSGIILLLSSKELIVQLSRK
jgi:hypothetical protein